MYALEKKICLIHNNSFSERKRGFIVVVRQISIFFITPALHGNEWEMMHLNIPRANEIDAHRRRALLDCIASVYRLLICEGQGWEDFVEIQHLLSNLVWLGPHGVWG